MATTTQNLSAANKNQVAFNRYGTARDSPQAATPQNIKIDNGLASKDFNNQNTAKTSSQASNFAPRGNERQVMTLQNSHIQGRKVDSPKIYVNESEVRPKTSAQGSRKSKNEKKPPTGTQDGAKKQKPLKSCLEKTQAKTPMASCEAIKNGLKGHVSNQRIDFTFQTGKEDLDGIFTSTDQDNGSKSRRTERNTSDALNKSTARLQQLQISKYQQSRQEGKKNLRSKSNKISTRAQRKRQLSQSLNSGTAFVKQQKGLQLPVESSIKSPQNQDTSLLNATAQLSVKFQDKPKITEIRERRTKSSDLNSRPSLAAASKKGMLLRNQKLNKSSVGQGDVQNSSSGRIKDNRVDPEVMSGQNQVDGQRNTNNKLLFSFDQDDKENYPSNSSLLIKKNKIAKSDRSKSQSVGRGKSGQQKKNKAQSKLSLTSLSRSSPNLKVEPSGGSITKMLGKQYFVDGEQMLRIMSPGTPARSEDPLKSLVSGGGQNSETKRSSPTKNAEKQLRKRKKSVDAAKRTLDSKSGERANSKENYANPATESTLKREKFEKQTRGQNLELTVKQRQQAQELLKKFKEENSRKTDRETQRQKAQEQQRQLEIQLEKQRAKKKRSKSCISKIGETVLSQRDQTRDQQKESANQTCLLSDALSGSQKRHAPKELSCVVELGNLKREINEELRRERQELGNFPRTAHTPGIQKPLYDNNNKELKALKKTNASTINYSSLRLSDPHGLIEQQKKSEERSKKEIKNSQNFDINHSKIRKYIERQKKKQQAKKSMEETITHEKHLKIKKQLWDLQNFQKMKEKQTSQQLQSGALRLNSQAINIKKIQPTTTKSSSQQIQLLKHVRNYLPIKNLQLNQTKKALKRKKQHSTNLNESSAFESVKNVVGKSGFAEEEFSRSQLEDTYNQQKQLQEDDLTNINIFSQELSPTISSHTGNQKSKSPSKSRVNNDLTTEHPLKELKSKIFKPKANQSESAKGPSKRRQQEDNQNTRSHPQKLVQLKDATNLNKSDFESIEPTRPHVNEDFKNSKAQRHRTPKTNSDQINSLFDQSGIAVRRQNDIEFEKFQAATNIQKHIRGYLSRRKNQVFKSNRNQASPSAPVSDPNNTGQSNRKAAIIPSLNLQKINSSDSNNLHSYTVAPKQIKKQQQDTDSARSQTLFDDRNSFQKIKKTGLILPQPEAISDFPDLVKKKEEEIVKQQVLKQQSLDNQYSSKNMSPRTYSVKSKEIEVWATREKEEVKKMISKQQAIEKEWQKTEQYIKNAQQDHDQINKILNSGRSSQKSYQPPRNLIAEDLPAYSARSGLNSFRIESQRQSHRVEENRITELIYGKSEKQTSEKPYNADNSSSSHTKQNAKKSNSHKSHGDPNSQDSDCSHNSDADEDQIPDFDKVVVFNQTKKIPQVKLPNSIGEPTLNRQTSYKLLEGQNEDLEDKNEDLRSSPRYLHKTDARSRLHDIIDDEVGELARQVFQVSPASSSEQSRQAFKDDFKESLKSENFFLKKTDQATSSPNNSKSTNIRIEIGDDSQNIQRLTNTLIGAVSPMSDASSNLAIQRGSMSLESSTSGENKDNLSLVIQEIKNDAVQTSLSQEQAQFAERLTDEVMALLVQEVKLDFPFLVNREAAQSLNQQQQQQQLDQQGLSQLAGIQTDLFAIERYIDEILEEVKQNSVEFMQVLNSPMSKNHLVLLNQLQNTEIGSCEHFYENFPQILPLDLYLTLERRRKEAREQNLEQTVERAGAGSQTEMLRILIAECEHIHNKVLFDCINDSLLQFKPYGKEGDPVPWSRKNRRLKPTDDFTIGEIFEIVKHDLFRWAITQAGTLPRREFVYRGVFDEELFSEIREKKLVTLLGREMVENEPKWLNYEFEQAQVKIDVGDMILELLVTETINILTEIPNKDLARNATIEEVKQESIFQPQEKKPLEPYEAHILGQMNSNGALKQDSGHQIDNSKDSDFSRNEEDSNANADDVFADNYFDDDHS